jgi:hypothetical protein
MKISDLITLAENKLAVLNQAVADAILRGEADALPALEAKVIETQNTLNFLRQPAE